VTATNEADSLLIKVRDCGAAFTNSELRPFFNESEASEGAQQPINQGSDLILLRTVAKAHRGKVWAERQDGNGSTIYLQFPLMSLQ
jgi:signal transduction histidine kinase